MRCEYRRCGGKGERETRVIRAARVLVHVDGTRLSVCEGCSNILIRSGGRRVGQIDHDGYDDATLEEIASQREKGRVATRSTRARQLAISILHVEGCVVCQKVRVGQAATIRECPDCGAEPLRGYGGSFDLAREDFLRLVPNGSESDWRQKIGAGFAALVSLEPQWPEPTPVQTEAVSEPPVALPRSPAKSSSKKAKRRRTKEEASPKPTRRGKRRAKKKPKGGILHSRNAERDVKLGGFNAPRGGGAPRPSLGSLLSVLADQGQPALIEDNPTTGFSVVSSGRVLASGRTKLALRRDLHEWMKRASLL